MNSSLPETQHVWDPKAYAAHSSSQYVWARELIARARPRDDERILDVGCGDGKVTAELAANVPRGEVVGVDASPDMIRFAREQFPAKQFPNLDFQRMDARRLQFARPFDLIFSNAALHWVDDHEAFLRGAAACLNSGGRLLISCGGHGNAYDVFLAVRAEIRRPRWRQHFRRLQAPYFFYHPDDYQQWLPRHGFEPGRVELAPKDALHEGRDGFAAWFRTTWLPYTQRVPEAAREEFIAAVADGYVAKHPPDAEGRVRVRMVRLEIDATRR